MCPLESAKIDSDWPSRLRSSRVSRTFHGSHVKWSCSITSFSQQLGEVFDHDVRAMSVQSVGLGGVEVADRAVVGLNAVAMDEVEEEVVFLGGDLVDGAVGDCDVA